MSASAPSLGMVSADTEYEAMGVGEVLRKDAETLSPDTAARIHLNAIHDVFVSSDPLLRRLGRERCTQFARLGTAMMSIGGASQPERHSKSGSLAPYGPLAYFCYYSWWPGEVDELHSLFDEYADAGYFDVDTSFCFSTSSGPVASGDSVLWYAILHKQPELLRAAMRHGASLSIVPAQFAQSKGLSKDDVLAWAACLHDEHSEIYRVLTAEVMRRKLESPGAALPSLASSPVVRRRSL